jgi:hypothetical protein
MAPDPPPKRYIEPAFGGASVGGTRGVIRGIQRREARPASSVSTGVLRALSELLLGQQALLDVPAARPLPAGLRWRTVPAPERLRT